MSPLRAVQQEVDERALSILRYRTPREFVFREQGRDFGIDCELEEFARGDRSNVRSSEATGRIFKAQVKGCESSDKYFVRDGTQLSKSFEIDELEYWYERMRIPVILFIVDVGNEEIYWTDFYADAGLEARYRSAKSAGQNSVVVHFDIAHRFPDSMNALMLSVRRMHERLALQIGWSQESLRAHLDNTDASAELKRVRERLAATVYAAFVDSLEVQDWKKAEDLLGQILSDGPLAEETKVCAVCSSVPLLVALGANELTRQWTIQHALLDRTVEAGDQPPGEFLQGALAILRGAIQAHARAMEIFQMTEARMTTQTDAKLFGAIAAAVIDARRAAAYGEIHRILSEVTVIIEGETHGRLLVMLFGPDIVLAISPLRFGYSFESNSEALRGHEGLSIKLLELTVSSAFAFGEHDAAGRAALGIASLGSTNPARESEFNAAARDLILRIPDSVKRTAWLEILNAATADLARQARERDGAVSKNREVVLLREVAERNARTLGLLDPQNHQPDSLEAQLAIVVQGALDEMDFTPFLSDCAHRFIYPHPAMGVPDVTTLLGIGFAGAWKAVYCFERDLRGRSVCRRAEDAVAEFRAAYCDGCEVRKAHSSEWKFDLPWARERNAAFRAKHPPSDSG